MGPTRPPCLQVHNALGYAFFNMEKTDAAIAEYRKAVQLQPGYVTGESAEGAGKVVALVGWGGEDVCVGVWVGYGDEGTLCSKPEAAQLRRLACMGVFRRAWRATRTCTSMSWAVACSTSCHAHFV